MWTAWDWAREQAVSLKLVKLVHALFDRTRRCRLCWERCFFLSPFLPSPQPSPHLQACLTALFRSTQMGGSFPLLSFSLLDQGPGAWALGLGLWLWRSGQVREEWEREGDAFPAKEAHGHYESIYHFFSLFFLILN